MLFNYCCSCFHSGVCHRSGGRLVTISDSGVQGFIEKMLGRLQFSGAVWIGLNDRDEEHNWRWDGGKWGRTD